MSSVSDACCLPERLLSCKSSQPFANSQHRHFTLFKAIHLSPYVDCISLRISIDVRPLLHRKRITLRCSYAVGVWRTTAIFKNWQQHCAAELPADKAKLVQERSTAGNEYVDFAFTAVIWLKEIRVKTSWFTLVCTFLIPPEYRIIEITEP